MAPPKRLLWTLAVPLAMLIVPGALLGQEEEAAELRVQVHSDGAHGIAVGPDGAATVIESTPGYPRYDPSAKPGQCPPSGEHGKPDKPEGEKEKPGDEKGRPGDEKQGEKEKEKESEDTPKPVQRPSTPAESPNPEELNLRPDEQGKIKFNFKGQPWPGVLEWLADVSGMSLDWQELPGDYLNLVTQRSYALGEARDLINRHLLARGYTLLRQGELLSVVKIEKLNPGMVPRVAPEDLAQRDPHEFVKVSFPLDWLVATSLVEELKPMLSPHGKLSSLSATNRLEVMDQVVNLREIHRVLTEEQSTGSQDRLVREFELQHVRAADVRDQLQELLGVQSKSPAIGRPMTPQQMQQMQQQAQMMAKMQQQQRQQQQKEGKSGGVVMPRSPAQVSLVVNPRKNSILAVAPPDKMAIIDQAIKVLDVPSDHGQPLLANMSRMQVYRLETVDPEPLVKTLEDLGDLEPNTQLKVDGQNKAIIAYASLADHVTIRALVDKLDGGGRRCRVIQLKTLRAESVARTIASMMGGGSSETSTNAEGRRDFNPFVFFGGMSSRNRRESEDRGDRFRVEPDVKNNALVLWANEFELAKVQELLESLRELPPNDGEPNTVHVYRLAVIDPEPVVKTLKDMGTLGPHSTLEVDETNKAIIAYASAEDHATIGDLLEKLDGSARSLAVIQLRRLQADYVAGTIDFLMVGGAKKEKYVSRYDYYPYTDRMRPDSQDDSDRFRVDADVEYNRLLLWANDIELEEVQKLLVKLGEIPAEGGNPDTVRVIDTDGGEELEALIDRIRRAWPSMAPNTLMLIPPEPAEQPQPDTPSEEESGPSVSPSKDTTTQTGSTLFRFAQFQQPDVAAGTSEGPENRGDAGVEGPPGPAGRTGGEAPQESAKEAAGPEALPQAPAETSPAADGPQDSEKAAEAQSLPPVRLSWGPDGRLIIASQDTKALDLLEGMLTRLAPPRRDYQVFHLKYALAYWVALNLEDFFEEEEEEPGRRRYWDPWDWDGGRGGSGSETRTRLSERRPLKFIADSDTNTILVQGADPAQLKTIEELIELYDRPEPTDSQSLRVTQVFHLRYTKAEMIQKALKDVYRDLLSSNDRALQEARQQRPERSYTYNYGSSDTARKTPKWKGLLSIGVDQLSNALIVSAPTYLFQDVSKMIEELDEAAKPVGTVRVVKVTAGANATALREKLMEILGEGGGGRKPAAQTPPRQPGQGGPPRPFNPPAANLRRG